MERKAQWERTTRETRIRASIDLDGEGRCDATTGIGFFDHMLDLLARHSLIDIELRAQGDLEVDAHHTVEDAGIVLGRLIAQALGDKTGIRRYGYAVVPMDEALASAAVDLSGRPFLKMDAPFAGDRVGGFDTGLTEEFFRALAFNAGITLHLTCAGAGNDHHAIEALFKAFARALREGCESDPRRKGVPSTKGVL
ncbi:MAG: imidazoleglycerol-phosphate dehydratase HisB [Clostridia bacterium]|nr:imidazoleglycerol-phosphate dehydratase HisB [Clostridia bacterium]